MRALQPGDTIKLTGRFLKATGQRAGGEGARRWQVVACPCGLCRDGRFVATNEPSTQVDEDGRPIGPRHFHVANVYRVGTRDHRNAD